jgi:hypothetical protein
MKKLLFILSFFVLGQLNAQTIKRGSINSVGFTSPNVNFSVGQYMAGNFSSGTNKITVGFQQPLRIMLDTSVAIIGDLSICPDDTTIIKANSSPFFTWFKNDTAIKAKDTSLIKLTQKDTGVYKIAYTDGLGHYDSSRQIIITKSAFQKPPTPTIVRDSVGNLTSNYSTGNQWYKDGVAIAGATDVKFKPLTNASYTVTTVQNGCASLKGSSYFFLVTDIINLEDNQFIKVMPNPYVSNLYLNFFLIKYNTLNADIFDFSTGRMVANRKNLYSGTNLDIANLSSGIYIVKVYSTDFKMTYTFKIVKL